jgi:hypothetical protein
MQYDVVPPQPIVTFNPQDGANGMPIDQVINVSFDFAMRLLNDSPITDPASLITFKKGDLTTGIDVPFTAVLNGANTMISITPDNDLDYFSTYTVLIAASIESEFDMAISASQTTFDIYEPDLVSVTFVVDVNHLTNLDPLVDVFYISGAMPLVTSWEEPGTNPALMLNDTDQDLFYSITLDLMPGTIFYKYFRGTGWNGGEWAGDPNREVVLVNDTIIHDWWGSLAVENIVPDNGLSIYPNPNNGTLYIANARNTNIYVYNVIGGLIATVLKADEVNIIDLSKFANGAYLVKIVSDNDVITKKIQLTR